MPVVPAAVPTFINKHSVSLAMEDIFVGRVMSSPVETTRPGETVGAAAGRMLALDIGSVVVVDERNQLEGILTTTDFVRMVAEGTVSSEAPVEEYMTDVVNTTEATTPLYEIADLMVHENVHHVPVVDEEEGVVGIVSTTDLTAYIASMDH